MLYMYIFKLHFDITDQFIYLLHSSHLLHLPMSSTNFTRLFFSTINKACFSFLPLVLILTSFLSAYSFVKIFIYVKSLNAKIGLGFAALMFLPSYFIFTSVPGKELLMQLFFTPIVLSILSYYTCNSQPNKFLTMICISMVVWFKPIYICPLLLSYCLVWLLYGEFVIFKLSGDLKIFVIILLGSLFLLLSWSFFGFYKLHVLDIAHRTFDISSNTQTHKGFIPDFLNYINLSFSFIDLSYGTNIRGFPLFVSILEFLYLSIVFIYFFIKNFQALLLMPLFIVLASIFCAFIIYFFQLPYSLWNFGTALRYRCDIYLLFITWLFIPFLHIKYQKRIAE